MIAGMHILFPDFNSCTVEVWDRISNFNPHFIMDVITYPVKGATGPYDICLHLVSLVMYGVTLLTNAHTAKFATITILSYGNTLMKCTC